MGHYHVARWRALQAQIGAPNAFAADLCSADDLYGWETALFQDPQYRQLSVLAATKVDVWGRLSAFYKLITSQQITHVALAGYGRPEYRAMAILAKAMGVHVTLFIESWYPSSSTWADRLKGALVSALSHTFFVSGKRAQDHLVLTLGIQIGRITQGYSVVDNVHFAQALGTVQKEKVILCVARFAPEKNTEKLIAAFKVSELPAKGYTLKLVGGGPQKGSLEALTLKYSWLQVQAWASYDTLPALYASAMGFILPSIFEPWGLVVNEALAAGLPVAASTAVGALPDLLNSYRHLNFRPENIQEITAALNALPFADAPKADLLVGFSPEDWASSVLSLGQRHAGARVPSL